MGSLRDRSDNMLDDLNNYKKSFVKKAQVAVIGSGPAGLTLARALSSQGLDVIIISSGNSGYDRRNQELYDGKIIDNIQSIPLSASRLRMFGGTSNHWTGHCGPFDDIDFYARDFLPNSGWPISSSELQKYYKEAQKILELGKYDYNELVFENSPIFKNLGPFKKSILKQNPFRFGPEWRDFFKKSKRVYVLENANLTKLVTNSNGTRISELIVKNLDGQSCKIICKQIVLACGGVENARILLNSNLSERLPCIGRFYAFHPRVIGAELHLAKPISKNNNFQWHQIDESTKKQFIRYSSEYQLSQKQPNYAMNLMNSYRKKSPEFQAALRLRNRLQGNSDKGDISDDLLTVISNFGGLISEYKAHRSFGEIDTLNLMTYVDPIPNYSNKIMLNNDKDELGMKKCTVFWKPSEDDIDYTYEFNVKFAEMVGLNGIGRVKINPMLRDQSTYIKLVQNSSGGGHQMGTTRISDSNDSGVVNHNLKVHGIDNLFCAGSSVFPTYSWVNPTMTIVALSIRLANHLSAIQSKT